MKNKNQRLVILLCMGILGTISFFSIGTSIIVSSKNIDIKTVHPIINHPNNISYIEGQGEQYIYWNATDDNPSNYTVTRNNDIIDEGIWFSGSLFVIDVSGLL
ncbi:MAG: hypothetical protein KGD63_05620, partial [Candidatus Lokiarchaeota archaeon]|nr:hypothetical protein [Candidatus Lokiarchaeota archaeon]